jgi:hypothetical protein
MTKESICEVCKVYQSSNCLLTKKSQSRLKPICSDSFYIMRRLVELFYGFFSLHLVTESPSGHRIFFDLWQLLMYHEAACRAVLRVFSLSIWSQNLPLVTEKLDFFSLDFLTAILSFFFVTRGRICEPIFCQVACYAGLRLVTESFWSQNLFLGVIATQEGVRRVVPFGWG